MADKMQIVTKMVTVKDLYEGYENNYEEGVVAYGGKTNVRPKYQREFIYEGEQLTAVIDTVQHGYPLNILYWVEHEDGTYEVLDGQQRIMSICEFLEGNFYIEVDGCTMYISNIQRRYPEMYKAIMDYELEVKVIKGGTKEEHMAWFTRINIAGEKLTDQELRNINYTGEWLTSAKRYFSKTNCAAARIAQDSATPYITNKACNRQEVLELALRWITDSKKDDSVCQYMAEHQNDKDATELWEYFEKVIDWAKTLFPNYRKEYHCRDDWGYLYNQYHNNEYDIDELNEKFEFILANSGKDGEIQAKKPVILYLFDGKEKHLSLRAFNDVDKHKKYVEQKGICPICGQHFEEKEMEGDHITPWSEGGKTVLSNCQMLCKACNRKKGASKY